MKITFGELRFLAMIGASHEFVYYKDTDRLGKADYYDEIMTTIANAKSIEDLIDNPT